MPPRFLFRLIFPGYSRVQTFWFLQHPSLCPLCSAVRSPQGVRPTGRSGCLFWNMSPPGLTCPVFKPLRSQTNRQEPWGFVDGAGADPNDDSEAQRGEEARGAEEDAQAAAGGSAAAPERSTGAHKASEPQIPLGKVAALAGLFLGKPQPVTWRWRAPWLVNPQP